MTKNLKNLLVLFAASGLLSCSGATANSSEEATSSEEDPEPQYSYVDKYVTPEYDEVDLNKYTSYYVDSENGSDDNSGLSFEKAWKSIGKVNSFISTISADKPSRILFKAGTSYSETLNVTSYSASEDTPLIISSSGEGNNGYATIEAQPNCIEVSGSNVRITNFELTSKSGEKGIYVYTSEAGALKNIVLADNYIHDINFDFENGLPEDCKGKGYTPETIDISKVTPTDVTSISKYGYTCSGIYFTASTLKAVGASWYEDVWVDNNRIEQVSRCGLFFNSDWIKRPGIEWGNNKYINDDNGWYPSKRVYLTDNKVKYTGGDGMVLLGVVDGAMEGNSCYHAQYLGMPGYYCAGLWCHSCKNFVFQYNEAAYTHLLNGSGDGQGFDIDKSCSNITFQYNYSHHNEGGGILLCTQSSLMTIYNDDGSWIPDEDGLPTRAKKYLWDEVIIRNNVFADNEKTVFSTSDALDNLSICNNTLVMPGNSGNEKLISHNGFDNNVLGTGFNFFNNIVYLRNKRNLDCDISHMGDASFKNNVFHNFDSSITEILPIDNLVDYDPGLSNASASNGIESVKNFIGTNSQILEGGILQGKLAKYDFNGKDTTGIKYVGAFASIK